jgi:hypothetical protein
MSDITIKKVADNELLIPSADDKKSVKEYFGIDTPQIITGVENSSKQEIVTTEAGKIRRNVVEAQEIYNIHTQKHHCWFLLDLETGKRGYYPGCIVSGKTNVDIELYTSADESSEIIETIPKDYIIEIQNMYDINDKTPSQEGWYKVRYTPNIGYIKFGSLSNIAYHDPI